MDIAQTNNQIPPDLLSGRKLASLFDSGKLRDGLKQMARETLEFAANEQNNAALVESILKSLKETEPDKANMEYAARVVEVMRRIAKNVLGES